MGSHCKARQTAGDKIGWPDVDLEGCLSDIFLSYSREDLATARRFAEGFERAGFTVWWDQSLSAGEAFDHATEEALETAQVVVVLWSRHSVVSRWVRAEATLADRSGKLVPVEIGPCRRPIMFELTQTADLSRWNGNEADGNWQGLLGGLRRQLGKDRPASAAATAVTHGVRKFRGLAIVGIAALLMAGLTAFVYSRTAARPRTAAAPAASTAQVGAVTLAVLPFANLSSDPEQEYFSDGLTEEILNQLAQVRALTVTGRTSSFAFKGRNEDLRVIGEKLGVANLLEGSVRKAGNELRITAQLNNARSGAHLWSRTYERSLDNVFEIQESIAKDVARALSVKLEVGELAGRPGMTRNVEAYDAFLASGRYAEPIANSLQAAMVHLERATTLDPAFVNAWASLANVYAFASSLQLSGNTPEGWAAKSDTVIERIKGISDYGQVVHEGLAADRSQNLWAMVDARKHFDTAYALAQKLGLGSGPYQDSPVFVLVTGRFREAITTLEQAKVTDPLNAFFPFLLSKAYAATGNLPAAMAEDDRGLELGGFEFPIRTNAVMTALAMRDRNQIERRLMQAMDPDDASREFYAAMKAGLDMPAEALADLHRRAAASTDHLELSTLAVWMAWFGDAQGALDAYRGHADLFRTARRNAFLFDIWSPVMRDMRKLPGFKDLMRQVGLVDYWKAYGWGDLCKPVGLEDFECQ